MNIEPIFVVAGGAVAFYLWQKSKESQARAVALPYQAPDIATTYQAAPVAPAPVAPSPTYDAPTPQAQTPWTMIIVVAVVLWYSLFQQRGTASKTHAGVLGKAFSTNDDRAQASKDAKRFSRLCSSLADAIEDDAKLAQPFFKNGIQLDDLRRRARIYMFRGSSLQAKYPELPTAVDSLLTARIGTQGGPLDNEQRRKWVAALRELATAAEEAAK